MLKVESTLKLSKIKNKFFQVSDSYLINYASKLNSDIFREVSNTNNSHKSKESKTDNNTLNKDENKAILRKVRKLN